MFDIEMDDLEWSLHEGEDASAVSELRSHLVEFNVATAKIQQSWDRGLFVRDAGGRLVAGISGWLWGRVLEIGFLWVAEELRGRGVGKELLRRLEVEGSRLGCETAVVDTYSFQAPEFYLKLGYTVIAEVDGYPSGVRKLYLKKQLGSE